MHKSSIDKMQQFVERYLSAKKADSLTILDLGSMDINGSYRPLFKEDGWKYQGLDLEPGKNVDLVLADPYDWSEVRSSSVDVVISGQTFEHMEFFWVGLQQMERVVKQGGYICIIAPSRGYEHRYPVDCWRFYPDGFKGLARYTGLELVSVETQWERLGYTEDDSDDWGDTIAVYVKPGNLSIRSRMLLALRRWIDKQAVEIGSVEYDRGEHS